MRMISYPLTTGLAVQDYKESITKAEHTRVVKIRMDFTATS